MVTLAQDAMRGRIYVRTRHKGPLPSFYLVPNIGKEAYIKRLQKKSQRLSGREVWVLRQLQGGYVLMLQVVRYRPEGERRYQELRRMTAVPPDTRLRETKSKPRRRT